jgi:hypothetical protein
LPKDDKETAALRQQAAFPCGTLHVASKGIYNIMMFLYIIDSTILPAARRSLGRIESPSAKPPEKYPFGVGRDYAAARCKGLGANSMVAARRSESAACRRSPGETVGEPSLRIDVIELAFG